jgi:hypothetical protein
VKWDDRGLLRERASGTPVGRARAEWKEGAWKGAKATGVLRAHEGFIAFEGEWSGDGLTLYAAANATEDALFSMWEPAKLSSSSLVLKGAPVRLLEARTGAAVVSPSARSMTVFVPDELPSREVGCDVLALRATPPGSAVDPRGVLARSGFAADAPELVVKAPADSAAPAWAQPGGAFAGGFLPGARVFELQRTAGNVRVAAVEDSTLWVAWVSEASVVRAEGQRAVELWPRERKQLPLPTWRACREPVPLLVSTPGGLRRVGTLAPGVRFAVTGVPEDADVVAAIGVWPAVRWFEPASDRGLLAPASASSCPVATAELASESP